MKIVDLVMKVVYGSVTQAKDELKNTEKAAKGAEKATKDLNKAMDGLKDIPGPIGEIATQFEDVKGKVEGVANAGKLLGPGLVAVLGVAAGAAGVLSAIRFAGVLDDLGDLAAKLGLSTTQALLLKQEMDDAGVSTETYANAVQRAANALSKADEEGKAAAEALGVLGVNTQAATSPTELLTTLTEQYADKLKTGTVTVDEMAALQTVLGRNYRESMIAVEANANAQERYNEFAAAGVGISADGEKATTEFTNSNKDLQFVLASVGSKLVGEVVPAFTGLINALVDSYKNGGLVKVAFDAIRVASQLVMVPIRGLFNIFIQLDAAIQSVGKSLGALFAAIATRSTEPFKALKEDLAALWATANSRTTGMFSWDSGETTAATPGAGGNTAPSKTGGGKNPGKTANAKDAPAEQGWSAYSSWGADGRKEIGFAAKEAERIAADEKKWLDSILSGTAVRQTEVFLETVKKLDAAFFDGKMSVTEYEQAIALYTGKQQEAVKSTEELTLAQRIADSAFKELENTLMSVFDTGEFSFRKFLASFIQGIARMIIQIRLIEPLMKGIGLWMGGSAKSSGSILTDIATSFTGARATGGPVSGNNSYLVGERGPEMFVPRSAGTIIPNNALGGGANISVTVNVQGGSNAEETGSVVSQKVVNAIKGVVRNELNTWQRQKAYSA